MPLAAAQEDPKSEVLGNKHTSFLLEDETSYLPKMREQAQDTQSSNQAAITGSAPTAPVGPQPTFEDTELMWSVPYLKDASDGTCEEQQHKI